jgi:hypothetical protein
MPARRPVNDPSARKSVRAAPPPGQRAPLRFQGTLDPSPEVVDTIARHLYPITAEEILYRGLGESPVVSGVGTAVTMFVFGSALGAIGSAAPGLISSELPQSVGRIVKTGLATGLKMGMEVGLGQIIELKIACARGRACAIDKVVAGATAGAICGLPCGTRAVLQGAARGALFAAGLAAVQASLEYI